MYDTPATAAANDRLWNLIRDQMRTSGLEAPETLARDGDDLWSIWTSSDLLLAQTCGYPYRARLQKHVTLIGTPDYGVPGCAPGQYRSVLVNRKDDPRTGILALAPAPMAVNEVLSQSGWAAPATEAFARDLRLRPTLATGSHRASALAVAEGRADWAALDAVTWCLLKLEGAVAGLKIAGWTRPTPGLPLITARGRAPGPLRQAVRNAVLALSGHDRETLMIRAFCVLPPSAYLAVADPPVA